MIQNQKRDTLPLSDMRNDLNWMAWIWKGRGERGGGVRKPSEKYASLWSEPVDLDRGIEWDVALYHSKESSGCHATQPVTTAIEKFRFEESGKKWNPVSRFQFWISALYFVVKVTITITILGMRSTSWNKIFLGMHILICFLATTDVISDICAARVIGVFRCPFNANRYPNPRMWLLLRSKNRSQRKKK